VFRLADEWLALPVGVLVEVTRPRTPHRIPHRGGVLAGVVNIRGELHLCIRLELVLGITKSPNGDLDPEPQRLVVIRNAAADCWAFAADEVDQVHRVLLPDLGSAPPTLGRAQARLARGVFPIGNRSVGLLDDVRMFHILRERI
jgi:chemotaxis-related protein WspD